MAQLHLVRHGQASLGDADYDRLSALGVQQSKWLGRHWLERGVKFDRVFIGTQLRHRKTAEEICRAVGQDLMFTEHPGFNEYDFHSLYEAIGSTEGTAKQLAMADKQKFFQALKRVLHLWALGKLPGAVPETWETFSQRVEGAIRSVQQCAGQSVLVVTSGGPIGMIVRQVLQAPAASAIELNLQVINASYTHFHFNERTLRLASFNNIPHLDAPDRAHAISYG